MNKYLEELMREMCSRVGADFNEIDFKAPNWYEEYTWTEQEQEDFMGWIVKYLKSNYKARKELMTFPHTTSVKELRKFAGMFILGYGWKCEYGI